MRVDFTFQEHYGIDDLLRIMELLRSPDGCPWDKEQTHESIRMNLLEEAYETVEAIDRRDSEALCEELGDVLLQVVFHSRMEQETGGFGFAQVTDGICKKLIERHPHVFGTVQADTTDEVLSNWEQIKQRQKQQTTAAQTLHSVPMTFPALMRAQKVQKRAAKAGFDWDDAAGAMKKLTEEEAELREAAREGRREQVCEELGDLLFSAVNVARFLEVDAEEALTGATNKFIGRFEQVEELARQRGVDMRTAGIEALDRLWEEVKAKE